MVCEFRFRASRHCAAASAAFFSNMVLTIDTRAPRRSSGEPRARSRRQRCEPRTSDRRIGRNRYRDRPVEPSPYCACSFDRTFAVSRITIGAEMARSRTAAVGKPRSRRRRRSCRPERVGRGLGRGSAGCPLAESAAARCDRRWSRCRCPRIPSTPLCPEVAKLRDAVAFFVTTWVTLV